MAVANDGTLYIGNKSEEPVSRVKSADSATKATQDSSGNTITTSYAAAIAVSDNNIQLKSKSGAVLATITSPYSIRAGSCNSIQIYNSNWSGTDGSVSAVYADANKSYLNLTASNAAGTAWPNISVSRINGHVLNMGYDGNLWISW